MKTILNPVSKNDVLINVKDYSSEEYSKSKQIEGMLVEALENIKEGLQNFPELLKRRHMNKGKIVIQGFEEGTTSYPVNVETK